VLTSLYSMRPSVSSRCQCAASVLTRTFLRAFASFQSLMALHLSPTYIAANRFLACICGSCICGSYLPLVLSGHLRADNKAKHSTVLPMISLHSLQVPPGHSTTVHLLPGSFRSVPCSAAPACPMRCSHVIIQPLNTGDYSTKVSCVCVCVCVYARARARMLVFKCTYAPT
jgi:hypothetical protein